MIIDAHTHAYDRICGVTQYGVARPLGYGNVDLGADHPHRLLPPSFTDSISPCELLMEYMAWVGVDKAVLLTQNMYGYTNDYLSDCVRTYPDKFVALGSLDPLAVDSKHTLEYLISNKGLSGLKLDLHTQIGMLALRPDFKLNNPYLMPLWELLAERSMTLALDLGGSYGTPGHQLAEIRAVLEAYPKLKLVICHLGFPPCLDDGGTGTEKEWHQLLDLADAFPVWFDTAVFWFSTMLKGGNEQYPYPTLKEYFRKCYDRIGGSRMIFGTDMPTILLWATYAQCIDWIEVMTADLAPEERDAILWKNAAAAYGFPNVADEE